MVYPRLGFVSSIQQDTLFLLLQAYTTFQHSSFVFGEKGEAIAVVCETQTQGDGSYSGWGIYGTFHVPSTGKSFLVAHLSECNPGTYEAGEVWGYSGNTGKSTGPHTHTEQFNGTKTGYAALPKEPTRAFVEAIHGVF